MFISPFVAAAETYAMGLEALSVINHRMALIVQGGNGATHEVNLMVCEKVDAFSQMFTDVALGASYSAICANFRAAIAANECRLTQLKAAGIQDT